MKSLYKLLPLAKKWSLLQICCFSTVVVTSLTDSQSFYVLRQRNREGLFTPPQHIMFITALIHSVFLKKKGEIREMDVGRHCSNERETGFGKTLN